MSTAIRKVHGKNGPWVTDGGYEYNLALIAIMVALADVGPGDLSLDHALGIEVKGPLVALLALAAGIGGAACADRAARRPPSRLRRRPTLRRLQKPRQPSDVPRHDYHEEFVLRQPAGGRGPPMRFDH